MNYISYDNQKFAPEFLSFIKLAIVANNAQFIIHDEYHLCLIFIANIETYYFFPKPFPISYKLRLTYFSLQLVKTT